MPQYFSPGVYVEEVDAGPKPIEGVSTSVAGAVGVTLRGPTTGKPTLVTSFGEFQRIFGGFVPEPGNQALLNRWAADREEGGRWWQFGLAVKGFFDNGGQQLFVKRAFSSTSTASAVACGRGLLVEVNSDADPADTDVQLRHLLGITVGTQLNLYAAGTVIPGGSFTVDAINEDARTVTLDRAIGQELRAGRDIAELANNPQSLRRPPANAAETTMTIRAKALGEWGNDLSARVRSMVGSTLRLQADPVAGGAAARTSVNAPVAIGDVNIQVDDSAGFQNGDRVMIAGRPYTLANVPPLATATAGAAAAGDATIDVDTVAGFANGEVILIDQTEYTLNNVTAGQTTDVVADAAAGDGTIFVNSTVGFVANDNVNIDGNAYAISNFTAEQNTTVDAAAAAGDVTITVAAVAGINNNDVVEINGAFYVASNVTAGPPDTIDVAPPVPAGGWAAGDQVRRVPTVDINPVAAAAIAAGTPMVRPDRLGINPVVPAAGIAAGTPVRELPAATTTVDAAANAGDATITVGSVVNLSDGDTVFISGRQYTLSNVTAGPPNTVDIAPAANEAWAVGQAIRLEPPSSFDIAPAAPAAWPVGTAIRRVRIANTAGVGAPVIRASGAGQLYVGAMVELSNGADKEFFVVDSVAGNAITFEGAGPIANQYFEDNKLRVIEAEVSVEYAPNGTIEAEETFGNLRLIDDGSLNYIVTAIQDRSDLIEVEVGAALSSDDPLDFPVVPAAGPGITPMAGLWAAMTGGVDNLHDLTADDFVGMDHGSGRRTGIQALEDIDDISICMVPNIWAGSVRDAIITHCETLRYRFAILDSPDDLEIQEIRTFREPIDTKYAALYYPWIFVRNPTTARYERIAPAAHMAGIYARVDTARGVHKAPANEVIRGIRGVNPAKGTAGIAQDVTKREQDLLNPEGINALRYFPGRGQRVWGARTLSSDGDWKYINVRRTFIFIERSIDEGTQWVVFEPNDASTWARVRQSVANFLNTQWRNGVLEGATPDEAYYVACDRGVTMTQDDIENGRLICEVGIAPVYPAEFVIFRIQKYVAESKLQ